MFYIYSGVSENNFIPTEETRIKLNFSEEYYTKDD